MFFKPLLLPLLAQVLLTFLVWTYLYVRRIPEIMSKGIDPQKLQDRAEAHRLLTASARPSNNLQNLFEIPVLFYVAVLLALALLVQDRLMVLLAWGFVGFRAVHSLIHCTYNNVNHRFIAYAVSTLLLAFMWARLGVYIVAN